MTRPSSPDAKNLGFNSGLEFNAGSCGQLSKRKVNFAPDPSCIDQDHATKETGLKFKRI